MEIITGHPTLFWAIFAAVTLVIEMGIPHFGCLFLAIAGFIATLISLHFSWSIQWMSFSISLILSVILLRPFLIKKVRGATGIVSRQDALIGTVGQVTLIQDSENVLARAQFQGADWAIACHESLNLGDTVEVISVDGIILNVRKKV